MIIKPHLRQGQMDYLQPYFYTETVFGFKHLLSDDNLKPVIIDSWKYLVEKHAIKIYALVIMPNHLHLIWELLKPNGKESAAASFSKFTAHQFKKYMRQKDENLLEEYQSTKADREYQFWKRDPLAVPLTSGESFQQKLDYIHLNPISGKWNLASAAEKYRWSSAKFYEEGIDEFGILTDYRD